MMKLISGLAAIVSLVIMIMSEQTNQIIIWGVISLFNHITLVWMMLEDKIEGNV